MKFTGLNILYQGEEHRQYTQVGTFILKMSSMLQPAVTLYKRAWFSFFNIFLGNVAISGFWFGHFWQCMPWQTKSRDYTRFTVVFKLQVLIHQWYYVNVVGCNQHVVLNIKENRTKIRICNKVRYCLANFV